MGRSVIEAAIRPLLDSDVDGVAALEAANQPAPWSAGAFRDELAAENRVYLLAEEGGELLGFGGAMLVGDEAHITNLLVAPEVRSQGIGLRLMRALIDAVVGRGARHLTLEVRTRNDAARGLYARLGLAPVGVRKGYYGDDDALVLWAHDIDSPEYQRRLGSVS